MIKRVKNFVKYLIDKYIHQYKYVDYEHWKDENIYEHCMDWFRPRTTGLPVNILLDDTTYFLFRGYPRILKFQTTCEDVCRWTNLGTMTIEDEPKVIGLRGKCEISEEMITIIKFWVKKYKKDLIDVGDQKLWASDFQMKLEKEINGGGILQFPQIKFKY
jgi:hypothetical protein